MAEFDQYAEATDTNDSDIFVLLQSGTTKRITKSTLVNEISEALTNTTTIASDAFVKRLAKHYFMGQL